MGKVVNLSKYREKKERDERATEDRAKSGRTKKERAARKTEALRQDQTLGGKRFEEPKAPPEEG